MKPYKDIKGVEIGIGDHIAYSVRTGNVAQLSHGVIVEFTETKKVKVANDKGGFSSLGSHTTCSRMIITKKASE